LVLVWTPAPEVAAVSPATFSSEPAFKQGEATAAKKWLQQAGVSPHELAKLQGQYGVEGQAKSNIAAEIGKRLNTKQGWEAFRATDPVGVTNLDWLSTTWAQEALARHPQMLAAYQKWKATYPNDPKSMAGHLVSHVQAYVNYGKEGTLNTWKMNWGWTDEFAEEIGRLSRASLREFELMTDLERQLALDAEASKRVQMWASSSGDSHKQAVWMQRAAQEEFDIPGDTTVRMTGAERTKIFEGYTPEVAAWYRLVARAMYENTQEQFRAAGITHISLYRGMNFYGTPPAWALQAERDGRAYLELQPMNSWSNAKAIANRFGSWIFQIRVPVERVHSTARTGLGCLDEQEFVVFNGLGEAKLLSVNNRTIAQKK
jgi:hypothetical protein